MNLQWVALELTKTAFVFFIGYAIVSDVRELRIPNWIPLGLLATFIAFALTGNRPLDLPMHAAIAGAMLAVTFGFFAMNWLGGGDAKLLSALALWAGPDGVVRLVFLVAIFGGLMALALLALRKIVRERPALESRPAIAKLASWASAGTLPYAVPIGGAALVMAPSLF